MNKGIRKRICVGIGQRCRLRRASNDVCALWLATLLAAALSPVAHAQSKTDAGQGVPPRLEGASKPVVDAPSSSRFEESTQHGFFGDLSRPVPPALNRIQGIRVPEANAPAREDSFRAPEGKPAAQGTSKATSPDLPVPVKRIEEEGKETGKPEAVKVPAPAATTAPAAN